MHVFQAFCVHRAAHGPTTTPPRPAPVGATPGLRSREVEGPYTGATTQKELTLPLASRQWRLVQIKKKHFFDHPVPGRRLQILSQV